MARVNLFDIQLWSELAVKCRYDANALAELVDISGQLKRYVRRVFGQSPQEWLDGERLKRAAFLICQHRFIKCVALELSFKSEMWAAKYFDPAKSWSVAAPAFIVSVIAAALLVYGYIFGYQVFKNIWTVTAMSVAGILVVEPLVAWLLFREMPTTGAGIVLILGAIGIITTIVVK